jgi:DNA-binding NarL/FixJ family response regulator
MKQTVRMILVDPHLFVRKAVRRLLEVEPAFTVCAEADQPHQVERLLARHHPDLAILDVDPRHDDGLTLIRILRVRYPDLPMLVLSLQKETLFAEAALRAGAQGYVMKNDAAEHLVQAVREVLAGRLYVSETIQQGIYARLRLDGVHRPAVPRRPRGPQARWRGRRTTRPPARAR